MVQRVIQKSRASQSGAQSDTRGHFVMAICMADTNMAMNIPLSERISKIHANIRIGLYYKVLRLFEIVLQTEL